MVFCLLKWQVSQAVLFSPTVMICWECGLWHEAQSTLMSPCALVFQSSY